MGQEQSTSGSGISRRAYLGAIGLASASTGLVRTASATESQYDEVVDIVEAGADNTGGDPIDDVFDDVKGDDTLVKFPEGEYVANELIIYQLSNFAMVGDDATLIPGDDYNEEVWLGGSEPRDVRIENFTIDNTADGVTPQVDISYYGDLLVRNVEKAGYHDGPGIAFTFQSIDGSGQGYIEGVSAPDGGDSVGLYLQGEGAMTIRDCRIEQFNNNGLYASNVDAPVTVEGGLYRNNNIAQVRLGSEDSIVRNATIAATDDLFGDDPGTVNMRGVRIADGPGPVTVDNCDVTMAGCQGSGGIVTAYDGGSLVVRDTQIHVDETYTTTGSGGSRTSYGVLVDDANGTAAGTRRFENVSITGGGRYRSAMVLRRDNNTLENVCIDQRGEGRDGIVFENSDGNTLSDSVIDVPDEEIVLRDSSVRKANVSTTGSCPTPGDDGFALPGELGTVSYEQTTADEWLTVGFDRQYDDPVVVSGPISYEGFHPVHTRVRDVTAGGFALQFEEWMYLDGDHRPETAHYLALSAGSYTDSDLVVEAGWTRADHEFTDFRFDRSFDRRPVVFAQPQTYNGSDPVVTRLRNLSSTGGEVMVQEEEGEANGGWHHDETVGYVAVEPGVGEVGGRRVEVGAADVHESWRTIEFGDRYANPQLLAGIQTFTGPNTANVRYRNLTESSVELRIEEEQSADEETRHRYERVGYAVVEGE
ncbi:right-handed parallel beta-helix repeat-containing protein [Halorarius litoreus]|uniref:right-handed parallel beta-helix repeat-containing protein n=1 Tax=Halorarius litoreus TaxID=2962676 RepID=UPI0020CF97C0|nr:right-handed parallel beta-helix repeat-containing protein [Halorarius litoreus]